jgi:hypothetical protein
MWVSLTTPSPLSLTGKGGNWTAVNGFTVEIGTIQLSEIHCDSG